ncbi:AEC family transporter [Pseudomonas boanensis]|uniref:AEC family transporter n=1 Tax=Metapseudomonas boanensis TaxID=2822138 RepID=A0ABS5XF09_9GAMM|nr:AEC family transporter [Pseudomonas boanensis]MBT8766259.1 AEC family transporter [Pseudomonas boanensis]
MLAVVQQTLGITAPVFSMLFVGVALKRLGWIDTAFINTASELVFKGTMPTLLFLGIVQADLRTALQPGLIGYFLAATVVCFLVGWGWAILRCPVTDRGIYTQGAFRGNNGIIGLALATSMYGAYGLSVGGILGGVVILSYNTLSAIVLAIYSPNAKTDPWSIAKSIITNPLIIGVLAAIPVAYFQLQLPAWLITSGEYFAQMTLPLALICIGGTLSLTSLRESSRMAISASLMKVFWLPLLATFGAWLCGFRNAELAILFLYFASPTAAASFVMARAVNGNHELAAAIIVITTLAAVVTTNLGLFVLQWAGWI